MATASPAAPVSPPFHVIRRSSIHNLGVFAARPIPKGARILEYTGEKITKAESTRRANALLEEAAKTGGGAVYIFTLNKKYDIDGNRPDNDARLINHSCDPNCEAQIIRGRIWIIALRDIAEGEELSFNYGFDLECWEDHPCRCGSPKCVGYIVAREYWPKLRRMLKERDEAIAAGNAEIPLARKARRKKKAAAKKKETAAKKTKRAAKKRATA